MAMFRMFVGELQQLRHDAHDSLRRTDAARLQRKLWRKAFGLAVIALGAAAMFLDAARSLSAFNG
ncbi:hypothetical protein P3W85_14080 [Cupriavidus basilensis]|uniref:Transmembrane protein n=1 Tax=Cupriavidus basilensis TaxID=68895 RepID=A0ABT6AN80_9BURK|nr:hypothetical protein [Cupriavidus basilensis]MDF3834075.1 hypothetical protein [Cupriavidus basilensis]